MSYPDKMDPDEPELGTLAELRSHAEENGGKCLSAAYGGSKAHHLWECGRCGHVWEASWGNVKNRNSWCPACCIRIREKVVRAAFQENFPGELFEKNLSAIGVELDGYSAKLSLAFEHDGLHHRVQVEHFQRTAGALAAQKARDAHKDVLCQKHGITLVRVPDREILSIRRVRSFVRDALEGLCYEDLPTLPPIAEFRAHVRALRAQDKGFLDKAKEIVLRRQGTTECARCPTRTSLLRVVCDKGHPFQTHYDDLVRGRWCPGCSPTRTKTEAEIAGVVRERGYTFVSTTHRVSSRRSRRVATVRCPVEGHPETTILWSNFLKGRGCRLCGRKATEASRRNSREDVQRRLEALGIKLLERYKNLTTPAVFECSAKGHRFVSSIKKIEMSPVACTVCKIDGFAPVKLQGEFPIDTDCARTQLGWACETCGCKFTTTLRGMCARKHKCSNKKCPSRET